MSGKLRRSKLRSSSDGELIDSDGDFRNEDDDDEGNSESGHYHRVVGGRNAFTLPRSSTRKKFYSPSKKEASRLIDSQEQYSTLGKPKKKRFRKPSMKSVGNLVNRVFKHMTLSMSITPNNHNHHHHHHQQQHNHQPQRQASLYRQRRESFSASSTDVRCSSHRLELPNKIKAPGIAGLRNHGNTCFMNAVLQCICHTDILAEYFVMDQYKIDLTRRRNKTNARKYGTKGEVTEQLALLLKSLWSCQYTPEISNQFKTVVGKYESQYLGSNQHDAQEFLLWLLDKVHEDLNTATKKKYKKIKNNHGRPEEMVAAEALANHMRCNSSFVHDAFQALYRSSLTCPKCQSRSVTFDPFLCVSIPIPQRQMRPVFVTVVYLNQQPKQVKLGVSINAEANVRELRDTLASDTGIPSDRFLLMELIPEGFHRTFSDNQPLSIIQQTDNVYAIEVPRLRPVDAREGEHLLLVWLNRLGVASQGKRFGCPYVLEVAREITYKKLQHSILSTMSSILKAEALETDVENAVRLRVVDGIPLKYYLPSDVDHPLYMPSVDKALSYVEKHQGPFHLKLIVEWTAESKEQLVINANDTIEEHSCVKQLLNQETQSTTATLADCFELYTQEEKLGPEDSWMCPRCKQLRQGVKRLALWTVPDLLIIHLKRFRQTATQRTKLTTLVEFPATGLDMTPHIVNHSENNHYFHSNGFNSINYWSPWRRHRRALPRSEDNLFDLYAVCNHHGNMQGGHYTAFCKNPADAQWYLYDDTTVQPMEEGASLVTPNAYILFYQRSNLVSPGSSSSSSSSSNGSDHWVYRMPVFNYTPPKFSKSQDNLASLDGREEGNLKANGDKSNFIRGIRPYNSMAPLSTNKRKQETVVAEPECHSDEEENYSKMYITESCV